MFFFSHKSRNSKTLFYTLALTAILQAQSARSDRLDIDQGEKSTAPSGDRVLSEREQIEVAERIIHQVVGVRNTNKVKKVALFIPQGSFLPRLGQIEETERSSGSAVYLGNARFISNYHVVANSTMLTIHLTADHEDLQVQLKVLARDRRSDLALLEAIDPKALDSLGLKAAELGDSQVLRRGQNVWAVGNPFDQGVSLSRGIMTRLANTGRIGLGGFRNLLQTDASINPGNSGGGLFDSSGRLIGIPTFIISGAEQSSGVGYAVPIQKVKDLLARFEKDGAKEAPYPFLGIVPGIPGESVEVTSGRSDIKGIVVLASMQKGLEPGDILLTAEGINLQHPRQLEDIILSKKPGDKVKITGSRAQKSSKLRSNFTIEIQLSPLPSTDSTLQQLAI